MIVNPKQINIKFLIYQLRHHLGIQLEQWSTMLHHQETLAYLVEVSMYQVLCHNILLQTQPVHAE